MTTPKQALQTIGQVTKSLAKITTLEEANELRDQASTLQHYVRASNQGRLAVNQAVYVKVMCERRAGELLAAIPRERGKAGRGRKQKGRSEYERAIQEAGISSSTAHEWQTLARVPASEYERWLALENEDPDGHFNGFMVAGFVRNWIEEHEPKKEKKKGKRLDEDQDGGATRKELEGEDPREPEDFGEEPGEPEEVEEVDPRIRLLELLAEAVELCPKVDGFERKQRTLRSWIRVLEGGGR